MQKLSVKTGNESRPKFTGSYKKEGKKSVYCSKGKDSLFETIETIEAIQRIPYNRPDRLKGFWDGDWDDPEFRTIK